MQEFTMTKQDIQQVFENWENNYRNNTENFMTVEEMQEKGVTELSACRTITFLDYLKDIKV